MKTTLKTCRTTDILPFLKRLSVPEDNSHKGQNGKILIIGGSSLFHAPVIWAAEIAAKIVDMVHFASTQENNNVMEQLKILFRNGIVVSQHSIDDYAQEDDVILIGQGMIRSDSKAKAEAMDLESILEINDEAERSRQLVFHLLQKYPNTQFVLDAGALQMMDADWVLKLNKPAIITPHQKEFERLFGVNLELLDLEAKAAAAQKIASQFNCIVVLKTVVDIVADAERITRIEGGNPGLTKGGTGDALSGFIASLATTNDAFDSCVLGSYILKSAADRLHSTSGNWYNVLQLIDMIPHVLVELQHINEK